jgi:hypothetical protein
VGTPGGPAENGGSTGGGTAASSLAWQRPRGAVFAHVGSFAEASTRTAPPASRATAGDTAADGAPSWARTPRIDGEQASEVCDRGVFAASMLPEACAAVCFCGVHMSAALDARIDDGAPSSRGSRQVAFAGVVDPASPSARDSEAPGSRPAGIARFRQVRAGLRRRAMRQLLPEFALVELAGVVVDHTGELGGRAFDLRA